MSAATNKRRSRGGCVGSRWLHSRSHGAVVVGLNRQRCRSARNAIKCENGGCLITRLISDGDSDGGSDDDDEAMTGPKVLAHVDLVKTVCEYSVFFVVL